MSVGTASERSHILFIDDHQFSEDNFETLGEFELAAECEKVILQCLYVARSGRPAVL